MPLSLPFDNSYARLPGRFHARLDPTPVASPGLIAVNDTLAQELGLAPQTLRSASGVQMLAGNAVPEGAAPLAQAYAGHQFGGWVPQLGDGRAILLGEVIDTNGTRRDIQLKGAGPTPFSRRGDGRAAIGPVLREYIVSEAMHALGIPTSRALAAVTTGEAVLRERPLPGAVLTRVAASHIRVGTFQYFAARGDTEALRLLTDHAIARHYPQAETALDLLNGVIAAQARLIARWMGVGFIHGVMNTDNMTISGETIDYGPCAFMDTYHPDKVFSSIDQHGRYAFSRQPDIAVWNLAQLASSLLPLINDNDEAAVETATAALRGFGDLFRAEWLSVFRAKLGLTTAEPEDADLISGLLDRMAFARADFTNTFRGLADDSARDQFTQAEAFDQWATAWQARLARDLPDHQARLRAASPAYIPRNHRIEQAIQAALTGDLTPFHALNAVLARPFDDQPKQAAYALPPRPEETVTRTFCGT
ncbi:protein adenylyltransferase SelO [Actibacterium sp. XHP0104]|uniref:protein adenylyltransferase SelO n=1 Tax=Actibacterium sp. XHP0104 TaxID=2984335 RepID=UPI0021E7DA1B|nr:YdiU family protein [Actibacterium sp. XHP0104]MCV2880998.1 YdiU family protein [Actibacterium sp. XHP0104]